VARIITFPGNSKYSEVELTLSAVRDWTEEGVNILTLWYRGESFNAAELMYVVLNGSAVVYNDDANAALTTEWTEWNINLVIGMQNSHG